MSSIEMQLMMHLLISNMMRMQWSTNPACALLTTYKAFALYERSLCDAECQGVP